MGAFGARRGPRSHRADIAFCGHALNRLVLDLCGIDRRAFVIVPFAVAQRYTRKQAVKAREVAGTMATRLNEAFHGVGTIKLNGLERYYTDRYRALTKRQIEVEIKTLFGTAVIPSLVDVMSGIGFACVIIYGGYEIISGAKTVGQFMAFFSALGLAFEPLRRLAGISGLINAASVSIQRMRDIFNHQPTLLGPDHPKPVQPFGDIEFKNVSLEFGETPVLRDVSFRAPAGKTTAIVGASGAGKTTIFNALTRLYAHSAGEITISGLANTDIDPSALRACISVVSQDSLLFDETLGENIILDAHEIDPSKLNEVISAAHVADFLPSLAQGMDTEVGPRGTNCPAGSVNGSPSRARFCAIRPFYCWMRPPQRLTPNQKFLCKTH